MNGAVWIVRRYRLDKDDIAAVFDTEDAAICLMRTMVVDAAMKFTGLMTFEDAEFWLSENDDRTCGWGVGIEKHMVRRC